MKFNVLGSVALAAFLAVGGVSARAAQYLVQATDGPSFKSADEAVQVLESTILPTFDALQKLEKEHRILAGGLVVGDRAFTFILDAASNDEVDQILRDIPAWPLLKWKVTPLQTFAARGEKERAAVADIKKSMKEKAK